MDADWVFEKSTTLYAHWSRAIYTVTFDPNGGTVSPASAQTNEQGRLDGLPTPERADLTAAFTRRTKTSSSRSLCARSSNRSARRCI